MAQKRKRKDPSSVTAQMLELHHYPTPSQLCYHAIKYLIEEVEPLLFRRAPWEHQLRILDHSAGTGVWNAIGAELIPDSYRVNVELQQAEPIRRETAHEWHYGISFQDYARTYTGPLYDVIWGNFPFKHGEEFVQLGYELLRMGGISYNLAPINFLSTQERVRRLYRTLTPIRVIHIPKRISFTKDGKVDEKEYVLLVHKKGCIPKFAQEDWWFEWDMDMLDIPEDAVFQGNGKPIEQIGLW